MWWSAQGFPPVIPIPTNNVCRKCLTLKLSEVRTPLPLLSPHFSAPHVHTHSLSLSLEFSVSLSESLHGSLPFRPPPLPNPIKVSPTPRFGFSPDLYSFFGLERGYSSYHRLPPHPHIRSWVSMSRGSYSNRRLWRSRRKWLSRSGSIRRLHSATVRLCGSFIVFLLKPINKRSSSRFINNSGLTISTHLVVVGLN